MPIDLPPGHFFLPGPTEVDPEVLAAQTRPMIGHRGRAIEELLAGLQEGLRRVFLTDQPVIISTSSATGLMEASVRNGVAGGKVLSLVNGAFSSRFAEIAMACGHDTEVWSVEWGQVHDVAELETRLEQGSFDAVTMTHSETSTGALQDLAAIADVTGRHDGVMLLIDSVTGVAGTEVRTDEWGLDFILTGSQKALALPPGLAFAVASPAMLDRSAQATNKGYYFDLLPLIKSLEAFQTPSTPAISLLYALEVQLGRIMAEGIEQRWERHAEMRTTTVEWADALRADGRGGCGVGTGRASFPNCHLHQPSRGHLRPRSGGGDEGPGMGDRRRLFEAEGVDYSHRAHGRPRPEGAWGTARHPR